MKPILYPYQMDYVNNDSTFQITNKSRQIGYSMTIAYKALRRTIFSDIDNLLVSSSQRQSNKLMSYVESFIELFYKKNGLKLVKDSVTQKTFSNGKSIYCFPSKPETVRGFPGDVRLDEYALHKEDEKMFEALLPSVSSNPKYQLSISSTPLGQSNMFYKIFTNENNYPDFSRTEINIYQAIEQGCKSNIEIIRRNFDEESFNQEYLCQFIDEMTSYFSYDILKKCLTEFDESSLKGKCYVGIDVGRTNDLTSIAVMVLVNDVFYLKRIENLKNVNFQSQKEIISNIIHTENAEKVLIDKGAIGFQLAEDLEKDFGQVEGVHFNTNYKNELVTNCKKNMEQGNFKMNEDRNLINDFHKIKRSVTASNQVNFDSVRDKQGHSDRAWAVMLGMLCAKSSSEIKISFV